MLSSLQWSYPVYWYIPCTNHQLNSSCSLDVPHIIISDFNSHNTLWGYTSTDNDGEAVELWAESNNISLIHNAKLPKSFNKLTSYLYRQTFQTCVRSMFSIQNALHTLPPNLCPCNPVIIAQPTTFRRRFNLKKADWGGFSADLDINIEKVYAIP